MFYESYHNHSVWSDGCDTLEDMVRTAKNHRFKTYVFSDHWVERPNGVPESWSMEFDALEKYVKEATRLKNTFSSSRMTVKVGLEVDFFPENAEAVLAKLRKYPFDYLIGAIHFVGDFSVDGCVGDWQALTPGQRDDIYHGYWAKMLQLCQFGKYDIVAHLDLPKKFGFYPGYDAGPEVEAVLQALAASGMTLELNTAGWDKPCGEGYPSFPILERAAQLGIPLVMSSDSHSTLQIGRYYKEGLEWMERLKG